MAKSLHILKIMLTFALWIGWSSYQLTRGMSITPSTSNLIDVTKSIDEMGFFLKIETFKERAQVIHNGLYSYELVNESNFYGRASVVPIICPIHGKFEQSVDKHLIGHGCRQCAKLKKRVGLIYGHGINDSFDMAEELGVSVNVWRNMLDRCYNESFHERYPTYKDCKICDEWLTFSNFFKWFKENYVEGYQLDKDILVKGNKVYSPQTCCFVPQRINSLLTKPNKSLRNEKKIGVYQRQNGTFLANVTMDRKRICLGTFATEIDAFNAYKYAKESFIKKVAEEYYTNGKITKNVYNALLNYKVEISD